MNQITEMPLSEAYWFQEGPGVRNWQFTTSGIKLLNVANVTKLGELDLSKTDRYLSAKDVDNKYSHFLVEPGDLVIASSGISFDSDGLLRTRGAFVRKSHLPLCLNTSTIRFKAKKDVSDLRFLKFWLDSDEFRKQITRRVTGSAQQNFGPSHLESLQIGLPTLREQKRIAAILEKADRLRSTGRYVRQLSDRFLQSVFFEMFGDPLNNAEGWPVEDLENLIDRQRPITYGILKPGPDIPDGVPYVRVVDMQDGAINLTGIRRTTGKIAFEYRRSTLKRDDVLLSIRGHVGRLAVVPPILQGANITQDTARLAPSSDICGTYLLGCLRMPGLQRKMADWTRGAAVQGINLGDVKLLRIPVPPLSLQQKFAAIVQRFERLRAQQREAERQAEHLFQTLLHRAFNGKL
jgi:type I restriction enzyme S subunit